VVIIGGVVGVCLTVFVGTKTEKPPVIQPLVIVIDGCEYFKCDTYAGYYVYTHKGNCTNHVSKP
jgi:hypothetical protein